MDSFYMDGKKAGRKEAADEIERLTTEVRRWADQSQKNGDAMMRERNKNTLLIAEVCDLKGRGAYLVAEVKDAWDKGRISVDTFHAALALEKITDSGSQPNDDKLWAKHLGMPTVDDSNQESFKHIPGCPHTQNMARPRSQQLIGPKCTCAEARRAAKNFEEWLESDEGKKAIDEITVDDSEQENKKCKVCDFPSYFSDYCEEHQP